MLSVLFTTEIEAVLLLVKRYLKVLLSQRAMLSRNDSVSGACCSVLAVLAKT